MDKAKKQRKKWKKNEENMITEKQTDMDREKQRGTQK
jgi:hypothetical protein